MDFISKTSSTSIHYYIKQQILVLGRGFSQWYDSMYFFLIQSFLPILSWDWGCFKYELVFLPAATTHFILFCSFLWLEIQPHDHKNSILNDVQWLWLFWNPPNIKTHGYFICRIYFGNDFLKIGKKPPAFSFQILYGRLDFQLHSWNSNHLNGKMGGIPTMYISMFSTFLHTLKEQVCSIVLCLTISFRYRKSTLHRCCHQKS